MATELHYDIDTSAIDAVFAKPEFGEVLTEWQRAFQGSELQSERLYTYFKEYYGGDTSRNKHELADAIDYALIADEEWYKDLYPDEAMEIRDAREAAYDSEAAAKNGVVTYAVDAVGPFAAYGLSLHMGKVEMGFDLKPMTVLREHTKQAERDLRAVEKLVASNPGRLLTILDHNISAARLGTGEVTLSSRGNLVLPVTEGVGAFMMSTDTDNPGIYRKSVLEVEATSLHNIIRSDIAKLLDGWDAFFDLAPLQRNDGAVFVLGEVEEGKLILPHDCHRRDLEWYPKILERIRTVGQLAARN